MAPKVLRKECLRCKGSFLTYDANKAWCNEDCRIGQIYEAHFGLDKCFQPVYCKHCGTAIPLSRNRRRRDYCDKICHMMANEGEKKKERISKANAAPKRTYEKALPLEERIRRNEYGRLYDEFHINRIIRGKS